MVPFYEKHVFFCTNLKSGGKQCCQQAGASDMQRYAKGRLKAFNLLGKHKIRISSSGCLGRCGLGPCIVIYPEGIWYSYKNEADIDEIITRYIINNEVVGHLLIAEPSQTSE